VARLRTSDKKRPTKMGPRKRYHTRAERERERERGREGERETARETQGGDLD